MSDDHAPDDDLRVEIAPADGREGGAGSGPSSLLPPYYSPPTLRRVAVRAASLLALALLVGVLLRANVQMSPAPATAIPVPIPLGPVVLRSNVSYGRVTLNGRQLSGSWPLVTAFRTGMNVLTLSAAPFAPQTCRVTWPAAQVQSGACETDRSGLTYTINGRVVKSALVVTVEVTLDALPATLQTSAEVAAVRSISAVRLPTTVPAGQYIATGRDRTGRIAAQRATAPLDAEVLFQIDTTQPSAPGGICRQFCSGWIEPEQASQIAEPVWVITVDVGSMQWRFTGSSGEALTSAVYPAAPLVNLALLYDGVGGWQVSQDATQTINGFSLAAGLAASICDTGAQELGPLVPQSNNLIPQSDNIVQVRYHDIEGCALQVQAPDGSSQGSFVWRFGVLLAADAQAHRLVPSLLAAPPAEIAAVSA